MAEVRAPVETSCAGPLGDAHLCSIGPAEWMMDGGVGCVTFSSFSGGSHGDVGGVGDILTSGRVTHNQIKPRGVGASGFGVPSVRGGRVEASVGSSGAGLTVSVVRGGHVGSGGADGALPVDAAARLGVPVVGPSVVGGGQVVAAEGSVSARIRRTAAGFVIADMAGVFGSGVSSASGRAFVSPVGAPCCLI